MSETSLEDLVSYELKDQIAVLTLHRPEKLNAFNDILVTALDNRLKQFDADQDAMVAIICGEGRAFSTGADVQHFRDWRASCRADGSCTVFTMTHADTPDATGAAHVFRLERPRRDAGWNVHLIAPPETGQPGMAAPAALDPSHALTVRIDRLTPEVFQPGFDFTADGSAVDLTFRAPMKTARVFEGMRAGLTLEVGYTNTSAQSHTDSFSLRGLSSALSWVEGHQPAPDTAANAG